MSVELPGVGARPRLELSKLAFQSKAEGSAGIIRHGGEKRSTGMSFIQSII